MPERRRRRWGEMCSSLRPLGLAVIVKAKPPCQLRQNIVGAVLSGTCFGAELSAGHWGSGQRRHYSTRFGADYVPMRTSTEVCLTLVRCSAELGTARCGAAERRAQERGGRPVSPATRRPSGIALNGLVERRGAPQRGGAGDAPNGRAGAAAPH